MPLTTPSPLSRATRPTLSLKGGAMRVRHDQHPELGKEGPAPQGSVQKSDLGAMTTCMQLAVLRPTLG